MCQRRQKSEKLGARKGIRKLMTSLYPTRWAAPRAMSEYPLKSQYTWMANATAAVQLAADEYFDTSANTGSTNGTIRSAIASFLNAPRIKSPRPSPTRGQLQRFGFLIWGRRSDARTIGPAIRCGKNRMNKRKW